MNSPNGTISFPAKKGKNMLFCRKHQNWFITACLIWITLSSVGSATERRRIYLNGVDISGAKHQDLSDVNISIDGQGHIFIEAPHYEVIQESHYIPLSSNYKAPGSRPVHKPAGPLNHQKEDANTQNLQAPLSPANPLLEKEGSLEKTGNKEPNSEPGQGG